MLDEQRRLLIAHKEIERVNSELFTDIFVNGSTSFSQSSSSAIGALTFDNANATLTCSGGNGLTSGSYVWVSLLGSAHNIYGNKTASELNSLVTDDDFITYPSSLQRVAASSKTIKITYHINVTKGSVRFRYSIRNYGNPNSITSSSTSIYNTGTRTITQTISSSSITQRNQFGIFFMNELRPCNATISIELEVI